MMSTKMMINKIKLKLTYLNLILKKYLNVKLMSIPLLMVNHIHVLIQMIAKARDNAHHLAGAEENHFAANNYLMECMILQKKLAKDRI